MNEWFRVALTFDAEHPDRPGTGIGTDERILGCLASADVRATFFVQGRWAEARPDTTRRFASEGHRIGNHSMFHARMTLLSDHGLRADVCEAQERIVAASGADPMPWFRCPFGDGHDDTRVGSALAELGYRDVHWNVISEDWERPAGEVTRASVDGAIAVGDGAVVLLHTWPEATARALPDIVRRLADAGATFVTVDELEALP